MFKTATTYLMVTAILASASFAGQFVSVNNWIDRSDDPTATDVAFQVTMTFTPAADLGGTDNKYEYVVENLTSDLTATLFRVANPDDLSRTMSGPVGWDARIGAQNFIWENGSIPPGGTEGVFEVLTPGLLPDLVTPPFALHERGWIMAHYSSDLPGESRIDVFGPIIHVPPIVVEKELILIEPDGGDPIDIPDPPDLPEVPIHTRIEFTMVITVTNDSSAAIPGVQVKDNIAGDLELISVNGESVDGPEAGKKKKKKENMVELEGLAEGVTVAWSGTTEKVHLTWDIGEMEADDELTLTLVVATDINHGQGEKSVPKNEYTSTGIHCLNSGATATAMIGDAEVSYTSNAICVDAVIPD